jgi:hypothetical protein
MQPTLLDMEQLQNANQNLVCSFPSKNPAPNVSGMYMFEDILKSALAVLQLPDTIRMPTKKLCEWAAFAHGRYAFCANVFVSVINPRLPDDFVKPQLELGVCMINGMHNTSVYGWSKPDKFRVDSPSESDVLAIAAAGAVFVSISVILFCYYWSHRKRRRRRLRQIVRLFVAKSKYGRMYTVGMI